MSEHDENISGQTVHNAIEVSTYKIVVLVITEEYLIESKYFY